MALTLPTLLYFDAVDIDTISMSVRSYVKVEKRVSVLSLPAHLPASCAVDCSSDSCLILKEVKPNHVIFRWRFFQHQTLTSGGVWRGAECFHSYIRCRLLTDAHRHGDENTIGVLYIGCACITGTGLYL